MQSATSGSGDDANQSDAYKSALETADELQEDLEEIADSNLPFAIDAANILEELERAQNGDGDK